MLCFHTVLYCMVICVKGTVKLQLQYSYERDAILTNRTNIITVWLIMFMTLCQCYKAVMVLIFFINYCSCTQQVLSVSQEYQEYQELQVMVINHEIESYKLSSQVIRVKRESQVIIYILVYITIFPIPSQEKCRLVLP